VKARIANSCFDDMQINHRYLWQWRRNWMEWTTCTCNPKSSYRRM